MRAVKDARQVTPGEFEVLEVLWGRSAPQSVGNVLSVVQRSRPIAYTTIMTVLDKLARKGSVARLKQGKAYYYSPRVERRDVLDFMIGEFAGHYFNGNHRQLRSFLRSVPASRARVSIAPPKQARERRPPVVLNEMEVELL